VRKIIVFNLVSLDGFFEGTKPGDIEWHRVDEEFNDFALEQLATAGGIIFGRVTYEGMASFWPSPLALEIDPQIAEVMNSIPKFVFSTTLDTADWHNTRLIKDDVANHVKILKAQPGKDLFIFGSADLTASFLSLGLIDELRIMVNPVLLGAGNPLFRDIQDKVELKLIQTRTFKNGNVLLYYALSPSS
jgi:dihydrofolate reductase